MLADLEPGWLWMIGGILLLIAEIIAPGFFLIWIGGAAVITGLFALYSTIAVYVANRWYSGRLVASEDPMLNDRAARLVGRSVAVVEAVTERSGRVRVGDSEWSARGGPAEAGEHVTVTGVDGNCLTVEPERKLPPA